MDKGGIGSITRADKVLLLHLSHEESTQADGRQAEGELADGAALAQPLRQPGQVAVTVQEIGVQPPAKHTANKPTVTEGNKQNKTNPQREPSTMSLPCSLKLPFQ